MGGISEKWASLTGFSRALIIGVPIGLGVFTAYKQKPEWFAPVAGTASQEVGKLELPKGAIAATERSSSTVLPYTTAQVQAENVGTWRHLGIPWNAQIGLIGANGGKVTAPGSLMQKAGINLTIERQDDYNVMTAELLKFAAAYHGGDKDPKVGVHSVVTMGDANPWFLAGLNEQLKNYGYKASVIGVTGRSLGEDKCLGKPEWQDNPSSARGGLIAAVPRDGDQNVCLVWAQANGIKVNPDGKTYDQDALNWFEVGMFTEANDAYITGYCEERQVVRNGKLTGDKKRICVNGVATWTPGDEEVTRKKGGLVSLLSTKENGLQMFATVIVIDEWAKENPATVTNFLKAALDGSALVANDRTALRQAADLSSKVWNQEDGAYWETYYYGRTVDVPNTNPVRQIRLGGSQAVGLTANLQYLLPVGSSIYDGVYRTFGDLHLRLYPGIMPQYPTNVVNPSFLEKIRDTAGTQSNAGAGVFETFSGAESQQVAQRSYAIQFAQGSSTILPASRADLQEILTNVTVGSGLAIAVEGHTSSEGDTAANQRLSEARATAVRTWLMANAPAGLITPERIRVTGMGESTLVMNGGREDTNASRRVEIKLLTE